jgi:superfamily II DNA or RNA helicase
VVDECHHVPADSYQAVVPRLAPDILIGLTATPERSDGKSLLPDFDGHIGAELRLWHALDRQLLVPFEYYGLNDYRDHLAARAHDAGSALRRLRDSRVTLNFGAGVFAAPRRWSLSNHLDLKERANKGALPVRSVVGEPVRIVPVISKLERYDTATRSAIWAAECPQKGLRW